MTTFLLIRHAAHGLLGRELVGRRRGVPLSEQGRQEANALAGQLCDVPLAALFTSPMARARETAAPLAERLGLVPCVNAAFHEIDFGEWTGGAFSELGHDPRWVQWNRARAKRRAPRGESMREAQRRAVREIERLHRRMRGETIGVVSHGDIVKSVVAYYLGMSLDLLQTIDIEPASVSVLALDGHCAHLLLLNDNGERVSAAVRGWKGATAHEDADGGRNEGRSGIPAEDFASVQRSAV